MAIEKQTFRKILCIEPSRMGNIVQRRKSQSFVKDASKIELA